MHSQIAIDVGATPERVFELARDITRWPQLLPHYRKVTVRSRDGDHVVARMSATRPGLIAMPVGWTAEQWPDASNASDLRLHFRHLGGATGGMKVTWHIRRRPDGCSVTIEHDFSRPLPLLGRTLLPALVDRLFVRPIAGRTLATFKALAEAGAR